MSYNDDLFKRVSNEGVTRLHVIYSVKNLDIYPIVDDGNRPYRYSTLNSRTAFREMLVAAVFGSGRTWVVAGWGTWQYIILMLVLSAFRRRFYLFTDAPVPGGRGKSTLKRLIRRRVLKFWFWRCSGVFGTGVMAIDSLRIMGVPEKKLLTLPYPLDESRFEVGDEFELNSSAPLRLVSAGRLNVADKRHDLLLAAYARLTSPFDTVLYLAGSGPDEAKLRDMASGLGIADRVEFLGWQDQAGLRDLYKRSNIYVHTADFEPYGVTLVEALYSGLYVVSADRVGSAREMINEVNGLVFKSGDRDSLTASLEYAIEKVATRGVEKMQVRDNSLRWRMDVYMETLYRHLQIGDL